MTFEAFDMRRWSDWLVSQATAYDDAEQRWLAVFMYRQLLWGRQILESARSTGDALPQITLRMPREGDMDYLRQVQAFCDFVVDGQLVGESPAQARKRTAAPVTPDELWVTGLIDGDEMAAAMKRRDTPEQAERRAAATRAFAALRVTTGEPSPALRDLTNRWITGEIDDEEYRIEVQKLWKID